MTKNTPQSAFRNPQSKRVLLIFPREKGIKYSNDTLYPFPMLGLTILASLFPKEYEVKIVNEAIEEIDFESEVDLVGITALTCVSKRAYEVADRFRKRGVKVILGGVHPSLLPDEAKVHADSVFIGEAEGRFPQVIEDLKGGRLKPAYDHLDDRPPIGLVSTARRRSEPADSITLAEELRRRGQLDAVGGEAVLVELTMRATSAANVEDHARIVLEKALLRRLISASSTIASRAFNPTEDALDLLDEAEQAIFKISEYRLKRNFVSMDKAVHDTLEMLESIHGKHEGVTGVPTGFRDLDTLTGGWQNSDLIIVAGRPSSGKTAFALSLAGNAALSATSPPIRAAGWSHAARGMIGGTPCGIRILRIRARSTCIAMVTPFFGRMPLTNGLTECGCMRATS